MGIEILVSILGAGASLIAGGLVGSEFIQKLIRKLLKIESPERSYTERLSSLTESLTKSSREVDSVLAELAKVARDREKAVQQLEGELSSLESHEQDLKKKIEELENVPIPVAEHFANMLKSNERRGALRDYILFGTGVVVTTIVAIVIQVSMGG